MSNDATNVTRRPAMAADVEASLNVTTAAYKDALLHSGGYNQA